MGTSWRRGHFLDPVIANMTAPINEAIARIFRDSTRTWFAEVTCLRCDRVIAVWAAGLLYRPGSGGGLGSRLSTDSRENVPVRCDRCRTTWNISGRGAGRRLREGLPPLA